MLSKLIVAFSTTGSSFRNKSKLTEFYKAIHPDILQNAPDNVKMENTRSLKILNSYFDAVSQNERTEPQELVFYMADKQNYKARNFLPFTIILDAFLGKDQQGAIDKVTAQIRDSINQKQQEIRKEFQEKQNLNPFVSYPNSYDKVKKDFMQTTVSVRKQSQKRLHDEMALRASIFSAQMQSEHQTLLKTISKEMRQANMPNVKPQLWTSLLMDKCDMIPNLYHVFEQLIDPRLIFFDEKLTKDQCNEFMKILIPTYENQIDLEKLAPFFKRLESANPQICVYVTDRYGASDIPGYYSIPYNFTIQDIQAKFGQYQQQIKKERQDYEKELKRYEQSLYNLADKYSITQISNEVVHNQLSQPLKNTEILKQLNLSLLMLLKQLNEVSQERLSNLRQKQWILTKSVQRTIDQIDHFYIPIPFNGTV